MDTSPGSMPFPAIHAFRYRFLVVRPGPAGVTQSIISYGSLMSQVFQSTQLAAWICRRLPWSAGSTRCAAPPEPATQRHHRHGAPSSRNPSWIVTIRSRPCPTGAPTSSSRAAPVSPCCGPAVGPQAAARTARALAQVSHAARSPCPACHPPPTS